jgi:hypothetical protein
MDDLVIDLVFFTGRVEDHVRKLAIADLPSIALLDPDSLDDLPLGPGVYFLTDTKQRLLYVGKAANIRGRWSVKGDGRGGVYWEGCHHCLRAALNLGDVRIAWQLMPQAFLSIVEEACIRVYQPPWNSRGRGNGNGGGIPKELRSGNHVVTYDENGRATFPKGFWRDW